MEIKSKNRIDWISLAIVCFLNVHFFYILGKNIGLKAYAGAIAFILACICFGFAVINRLRFSERNFPYLLFLNIAIFPIFSIEFLSASIMNWTRFLTFSVFPMILMMFKFEPKKVIDYSCYFVPLTLFIQNDLFKIHGNFDQMEMGYSYAVVHLCVACIIELIFYRKENKGNIYLNICTLIGIYLTIKLFFLSTRGTFLSIITTLLLFYITNFDEYGTIKKHSSKTICIFIAVAVIVINLDNILGAINSFILHFGNILPAALKKTLDAFNSNDLSHGRDEISTFTWKYILNKPIFGYGTQSFRYYNGHYAYPHNCVLQLLFENGILGSIYILINLAKRMFLTIFPKGVLKKDEILAKQLIMLAAIPMLFFSNEMWTTPAFWMFLVYV